MVCHPGICAFPVSRSPSICMFCFFSPPIFCVTGLVIPGFVFNLFFLSFVFYFFSPPIFCVSGHAFLVSRSPRICMFLFFFSTPISRVTGLVIPGFVFNLALPGYPVDNLAIYNFLYGVSYPIWPCFQIQSGSVPPSGSVWPCPSFIEYNTGHPM